MRKLTAVTSWCALALGIAVSWAHACQICVPLPTKTAADWMLDADTVVFAREDPDRPFHFAVVEVLKGGDTADPLELFVDSSTRRIQAARPQHRVVCVWTENDGEMIWRRVGYVDDAASEALARDIVRLGPSWRADPDSRFDYFAEHLGNPHPIIGPLAYLEIGQASYAKIRTLKNTVDRREILTFLDDIRMLEWQALYILLLGLSDHPADGELIRERIARSARTSSTFQLAAWATALVELDGTAGIHTLRDLYLGNTSRRTDEIAAIRDALRVQGDAERSNLMDTIVTTYGELMARHPDFAADLADDLTRWQRFDLAPQFSALLRKMEPPDRIVAARIQYHLLLADTQSGPASR